MKKSTRIKRKLAWASVFILLLLLGGIQTSLAQRNKVDLKALVTETQKMSQKSDEVTMVWWIPEEYWQVSLGDAPTAGVMIESVIKKFRPYTLIAVVDGKMGLFGGVTFSPEADIRASMRLRDSKGIRYLPLTKGKVDADVRNALSMMQPILANMLGPMGQNMHFLLFPAENNGRRICDAKRKGMFWVELDEKEFRWRLPLGSLIPPKVCPTCGERLNGAYKFCPWDGTKLHDTKQ